MTLTESKNFIRQIEPFLLSLGLLSLAVLPILTLRAVEYNGIGVLAMLVTLVVAGLGTLFGLKNRYAGVIFFLVVLPWQPFLTMPLSDYLGGSGVKLIVVTKESFSIFFMFALFYRHAKKLRLCWIDLGAAVFLFVHLIYIAYSQADLIARMVAFREGFMILVFYSVGRLLMFDMKDVHWFAKAVVLTAVPVAVFGYIEHFLFSNDIWIDIGAADYFSTKLGEDNWTAHAGLPINWYTYIDGELVRRVTSGIGEATSFSYFLSFPVLALIYLPVFRRVLDPFPLRMKHVLSVVIGAILAMSYARGGIIIVLFGVTLFLFARYPKATVLCVIPAGIIAFSSLSLFAIDQGSNLYHLIQMLKGVNSLVENPVGNGLGTSSQQVINFNIGYSDENMGDSYFAGVAYQMGALGVLAFCSFFFIQIAGFLRAYINADSAESTGRQMKHLSLLCLSVLAGIFVTALLSSSAVTPISSGIPLIFCGTVVGILSGKGKTP